MRRRPLLPSLPAGVAPAALHAVLRVPPVLAAPRLRIAYIKGYGEARATTCLRSDDFHLSLWQWFVGGVRVLFRPAGRIYFCPACLHDW